VVGLSTVMSRLNFGEASDTLSGNPMSCAAVLATLDEFEQTDVIARTKELSAMYFEGLAKLKETGLISKVRGEGMVFGIECAELDSVPAHDLANRVVSACYQGEDGGDGIHLLGALAGKVLRVSPPLTITDEEARDSLDLLYRLLSKLASELNVGGTVPA